MSSSSSSSVNILSQREEWKPVPGFPHYQVSSLGRVRNQFGNTMSTYYQGKYLRVSLSKYNVQTDHFVHVLVARAFLRNPKEKPTVDHKDRNPINNVVSNLRWATHKEQNLNRSKYKKHSSGGIPVIMMDPVTNEELREFSSAAEAGWFILGNPKQTPKTKKQKRGIASNITAVCNGRNKSASGYKWKHKDIPQPADQKWKPMVGHEGYFVSNYGQIKGSNQIHPVRKTKGKKHPKFTIGKESYTWHCLVAETWIPNPNPDTHRVVTHKDKNPLNCHISNLEWTALSTANRSVVRPRKRCPIRVTHLSTGQITECATITEASKFTGINKNTLTSKLRNGKEVGAKRKISGPVTYHGWTFTRI